MCVQYVGAGAVFWSESRLLRGRLPWRGRVSGKAPGCAQWQSQNRFPVDHDVPRSLFLSFIPAPCPCPCPSLQAGPHSAQDVDFALGLTLPTTPARHRHRQTTLDAFQQKAAVQHGFLRRQDPLYRAAPRHRPQWQPALPPPAQQDRAPPPPGPPAQQHDYRPAGRALCAAHHAGEV